MSHIAQRIMQMQMLTTKCAPLIGQKATEFLLETIPMLDWLDQARHAWRAKYKGQPMLEQAEDAFLEYFTKTQLNALRHILDENIIPNDKRKEAITFVIATLGGMTFAAAQEARTKLGDDIWLEVLLVPEAQQKPN